MTNVVRFPRRPRHQAKVILAPIDVHDAFATAAILIHDWAEITMSVAMGLVRMEGDDPYPAEFPVTFEGVERLPTELFALIVGHLQSGPLPSYLVALFATWNRDDADNPVLTYADAVEFIEGDIFNANDERLRATGGMR